MYEALRLFGDRMADKADSNRLNDIIHDHFQRTWGYKTFRETLENCFYVPSQESSNHINEVTLTKIDVAKWSDTVKTGMAHYGKE